MRQKDFFVNINFAKFWFACTNKRIITFFLYNNISYPIQAPNSLFNSCPSV